MRRVPLIVLAFFLLAIIAAGCAQMQPESPDEPAFIPSLRDGVTSVGNSTEELEIPKAVYLNETHGVCITHPARWQLERSGDLEARFSYANGVDLVASFLELAEDETFDDFLLELRGGRDGLEEDASEGLTRDSARRLRSSREASCRENATMRAMTATGRSCSR